MTAIVDWFIPADLGLDHVIAGTSTRALGLNNKLQSSEPWNNLNLGLHVGDSEEAVLANRNFVRTQLKCPNEPFWLNQVHGLKVAEGITDFVEPVIADASFSVKSEQVLAVMSADCLPIILAAEDSQWIAVVHCGWRSLAAGILINTLKTTVVRPSKIRAWLGPAIGPQAFEVGDDVRQAFLSWVKYQNLSITTEQINHCFRVTPSGKYLADLTALAKIKLNALGLNWVTGGDFCTYTDAERFFSYRRDGTTGRMATLAWIK